MFVTGAVLHPNGGEINVAVIGDSQIGATNNYQVFLEPLEPVFYRGGPEVL